MGENICGWQGISLQNLQIIHVTEYPKNKQYNQKMGRRPKQTFLQRRHTDVQEAYEKMLNITNYCMHAC